MAKFSGKKNADKILYSRGNKLNSVAKYKGMLIIFNIFFYRSKKKNQTTGSGKVTWPYYYDLHKFLGCLAVNDLSLVDDSLPGDVVEVFHWQSTGHVLSSTHC